MIINSANRLYNLYNSNYNLYNRSNRRTNYCLYNNKLVLIYIDC